MFNVLKYGVALGVGLVVTVVTLDLGLRAYEKAEEIGVDMAAKARAKVDALKAKRDKKAEAEAEAIA